jgi:hypothetical protein
VTHFWQQQKISSLIFKAFWEALPKGKILFKINLQLYQSEVQSNCARSRNYLQIPQLKATHVMQKVSKKVN